MHRLELDRKRHLFCSLGRQRSVPCVERNFPFHTISEAPWNVELIEEDLESAFDEEAVMGGSVAQVAFMAADVVGSI